MTGVLLGLLAVVALIAANAFFVAAEFGLVSARRPVIEERAAGGSRRARAALREMRNISFMLSGAQFGITVSSLLLGYIAEPAFAAMLRPLFLLVDLPEGTALAVSLTAGLVVSTVSPMIIGELAPKNLAISRPEATSLAVALPLRAYSLVFGPVIRLFDRSANVLSRLLGVEPKQELLAGYSPDELAFIFEASGEEGFLSREKADMLLRAVELGERRVSEVMVPGPDVVWLSAQDPVEALREASRETGHSRFPVRGDDPDDLVGTVHIKDLLDLPEDTSYAIVADIVYEALVVPESHTLRRLLSDLRQRHRTFAVAVDEFGGIAGIVTLEDVLEEIVGEIEDEFDRDTPALRRLGVGRYVIAGGTWVGRLEEITGSACEDGDYDTVAGFVIDRLGHIPDVGEWVDHDSWRLVVTGVDGNRISEILLERRSEHTSAEAGS